MRALSPGALLHLNKAQSDAGDTIAAPSGDESRHWERLAGVV
jgi:hypothetical protein